MRRILGSVLFVAVTIACGGGTESERLRSTSRGVYDPETGALRVITFDKNQNGVIDTWTEMDGTRPVSSRLDQDEDGVIDRWEEYDEQGQLTRAGWVRAPLVLIPPAASATPTPGSPNPQREPDTWAYMGPDGQVERIEYIDLTESGERLVTLREFYDNGQIVRAEEDANADGHVDTWQVYENDRVKTSEYDDGTDEKPDRRLTYNAAGQLVLIESAPDAQGRYTKRVIPRD